MLNSSEKDFDDLPKYLLKESPKIKREPQRQLAITEFLIKSDSRNNYMKTLNDPVRFHQKYRLYREDLRIKQEVKSEKDTLSQEEEQQPLSQFPGLHTYNTQFSQSVLPSNYDSLVSNTDIDDQQHDIKKKINKKKGDSLLRYGAYVFDLGKDGECSPQLLVQLGESFGCQHFKNKFHGWSGLIYHSDVDNTTYYLYIIALICSPHLRGTQLFKQVLVPHKVQPLNFEITFLRKEMISYFFTSESFEIIHNSLPQENLQYLIKKNNTAAQKLHRCPLYNLKVVAKQINQIERPTIAVSSVFVSLTNYEDQSFQCVKNYLKTMNPIVFDDGQRSLRYEGLINLFNEGKDQFRDFELLLKHLKKSLENQEAFHWEIITHENISKLESQAFDKTKRNIFVIYDNLWLLIYVPSNSDIAYLFGCHTSKLMSNMAGSVIINKVCQFLTEREISRVETFQDNAESQCHRAFYTVYLLFSLLNNIEKPEGSYEKITVFKLNLFKELSLQVYGKKDI